MGGEGDSIHIVTLSSCKAIIGRLPEYVAVTCHLHFWQNDRDLLLATAVTRGWKGYRDQSQHRILTPEKRNPETFGSRVRHSNH